ncbi:ATP-binding protein [Winogradskyella endarachnes]|uniref:histidine kinase n=1 Tax=Winogradskyella endarachnes TaxID=2681965 RepID=A0A6L6U8L7_9FLAO|nr:sensor histidine kinase [Winogradskyella endarachnes]MUU78690.1 two-component sensor histidine kinase [Winogradskyella endarachnes]
MKLKLVFILAFYTFFVYSQNNQISLDNIQSLRLKSQDYELPINERINYAEKATLLSKSIGVDSTILLSQRNLSLLYFESQNFEKYRKINFKNLNLSQKLNDTTAIAVANFNLGSYFKIQVQNDSAYYYYKNALELYSQLGEIKQQAYLHYQIADIQDTERDYIGSEVNAIKSIKLIEKLPISESNLDALWDSYNLLGIISQNLNRFTTSLEYHIKAYSIADAMIDGDYNIALSINNQAGVYRELMEYDKALELYLSLIELRNQFESYDPTFYPLIIDNIAYTKVLAGHKDYSEISEMLYEAYEISNNLQDDITKLAVTIDLSKFYRHLKVKDSTLKYATKSYNLSKKISSNDILLESMLLLSELNEGNSGKKYLKEHIQLTDSLLQVERNVRNKFARIELETDQLEAENKQISKENVYLLIVSIGLLLTAILTYLFISQRAKNRKLQLLQVQQKANEDIYNLMLGQQDKVDEARAKEKIRISKELHDGVLGGLFGVRLSLDSINFNEGKEAMMTRAKYIGQLQNIEQEIRKISHELNTDFVSGSGFIDIVSELVERQAVAYGLEQEFNFSDDINWDFVSNKTKINIYRIIQESMQNIYKHANANSIKISISLEKDLICLDIIDDGKGFDISKSKKGIGLKNMKSRVDDIDGEITWKSLPNNGTTVKVKIPYTEINK